MGKETYKLLQRKKRKGLELFYERYAKKLFGYARNNWQCDEDTAWDLIYKTLDVISTNIDKYEFESEEKFGSFVLVTFLNRMRNHHRDSKKNPETIYVDTNSGYHEMAETNNEADPENDSLLMQNLKDQLGQLQEWERMLLLLRAQRMPYCEIAKYVDKPEQQLKVYYQRLKNKLIKNINVKEEVQNG